MARIWSSKLKSIVGSFVSAPKSMRSGCYNGQQNSLRVDDHFHIRPIFDYVGHNYHTGSQCRILKFEPRATIQLCKPNYGTTLSPTLFGHQVSNSFASTPVSGYLSYSSFTGNKGGDKGIEATRIGNGDVDGGEGEGGIFGSSEWIDKVKDAWKTVVDAANVAGEKAKEASDVLTPHVQQVWDTHPYLKDVVVPVGGTLTAALLAWLVLPSVLKRLHKYSTQGSAALLAKSGSISAAEVPYEKSVWGAMEDPVRYMLTFMAFSQMLVVVLNISSGIVSST